MFYKGKSKWVLFLLLALALLLAACTTPPEETAKKACADSGMTWKIENGVVKCVAPNTSTQAQGNTSTQGANTSTQAQTSGNTGQSGDPELAAKLLAMPLSQAQQWLAQNIGGDASKWGYAGNNVWTYWNKDVKSKFVHPGKRMILTYWSGFAEPSGNTRGCHIQVPPKGGVNDGTTRTIQCTDSGAVFEADGVGLHITPQVP